jgi:hypothetical protein
LSESGFSRLPGFSGLKSKSKSVFGFYPENPDSDKKGSYLKMMQGLFFRECHLRFIRFAFEFCENLKFQRNPIS